MSEEIEEKEQEPQEAENHTEVHVHADPRDAKIEELTRTINELTARIEELTAVAAARTERAPEERHWYFKRVLKD